MTIVPENDEWPTPIVHDWTPVDTSSAEGWRKRANSTGAIPPPVPVHILRQLLNTATAQKKELSESYAELTLNPVIEWLYELIGEQSQV